MDNMGITFLVGKEIRCKEPWTLGAAANGVENAVNSRDKPRVRPVNARLSRGYLKILVDVSPVQNVIREILTQLKGTPTLPGGAQVR